MYQHENETIQEFITNLRICALDCAFICPFDDPHDLTDYHLIKCIRTGVYNETLQQEILQKHEALNTVDRIVQYCENFESTKRDKEMLHASISSATGAAVQVNTDLSQEDVVAALSAYRRQKRSFNKGTNKRHLSSSNACTSCGYIHSEEKQCPTADKYCLKCSKKGNFSCVCHQRSDKTLSAVFVSAILSSCSNTNDALRSISVLLGEQFVPFPQMLSLILVLR